MNLYKKLKPEIKKALKANVKRYPTSGRILIAKLYLHTMFHELTMGDIRDLINLSDTNDTNWSNINWRYGDKLFKTQ
jgi:hypothetical protein